MKGKFVFFRTIVWGICVYHVVLGIILNCPINVIRSVVTNALGATRLPDPSALFLAKMLGGYMLFFGVGMGLAAWDPIKNRSLLSIGALLILFRCVQRILNAGLLNQALGVTVRANWITISVLILFTVVLVAFRLKLYRESKLNA